MGCGGQHLHRQLRPGTTARVRPGWVHGGHHRLGRHVCGCQTVIHCERDGDDTDHFHGYHSAAGCIHPYPRWRHHGHSAGRLHLNRHRHKQRSIPTPLRHGHLPARRHLDKRFCYAHSVHARRADPQRHPNHQQQQHLCAGFAFERHGLDHRYEQAVDSRCHQGHAVL